MTPLLVSIAVGGVFLLIMLWQRLRAVSETLQLKRHRTREPGVCDLLNYAAVVAGGVVIGKNGALIAAWEYSGEDSASTTDIQKDVVSVRLNQALSRLGSGWMVHVDAVRQPVDVYSPRGLSHFPDRVTAAIDEERRELFETRGVLYETRFVLSVSYMPPAGAVQKLSAAVYDDDTPKGDETQLAAKTLETFERELKALENRLSSSFKLRRLRVKKEIQEDGSEVSYDELLRHLQLCATGIDQPIRLPSSATYLDAIVGGQELWGGVTPRIGRKFLQVVAIEGFPTESFAGILTTLGELAIDYRWSSRFIFLDSWEALSHIERFRKKWQQQVTPFLAQLFNFRTNNLNEDAMQMVSDASHAKLGISGGAVSAGYYTGTIVFFGENREEVENAARVAEKAVNHLGFTARVETVNTMDAWLGTLPGHGVENVRRPLINTMNLADLLPVASIWTGEDKAPCKFYPPLSPPLMHCVTTGATPLRLNLHVGDLGHTVMFGPTGMGKSTHLGLFVAQLLRYAGMTVYAFDKGMSMYTLCKAAGGTHYNPAGDDDQLSFCPLQYLETRSDRAWAKEWITQICALNGLILSPAQGNETARALENMRANAHKTMTDFVTTVQDSAMREVLREYTIEGSMGQLFDAREDNLGLTHLTVFEIEELMNLAPKYGLPLLLYLFRRIERSLTGQPAAIVLDEAWLMLGHPVFRDKIKEWLKVLRKANCLVLMATQSLSDAINSGILDIIVESTASKIFLPNPYARQEDTAAVYRRFGLNERQIEIIAKATPKREYYYVSELGRRLYELALGPLALALIGVSDKDGVAEVRKCEEHFGAGWVDEWLRRRGLSLDQYLEATLKFSKTGSEKKELVAA
jgi:type IV secretion/conjugal transfer VirB4 family ATPase